LKTKKRKKIKRYKERKMKCVVVFFLDDEKEKNKSESREEFFKRNAGCYEIPETTEEYHKANQRLKKFEEFAEKHLPIIRKAYKNSTEIEAWYTSVDVGEVVIRKSGKIESRFENFDEFLKEFSEEHDLQKKYAEKANKSLS
jgi:hypothetical protein